MLALKVNHISSFQIFQVLKYSGQILINIALAKTYLTTSEIGKFESFLFIASSVSFFWVTGIMQSLLSIYPSSSTSLKKKDNSLFFSSFILILLLSLVTFIFISLFFNIVNNTFSFQQKSLLLIYLLINPVSFLIEYILLLKKRLKDLVVFGVITFIVPCIFISAPAFSRLEIDFSFYGLLTWSFLKLLFVVILIHKYNILKIDKKEISHLFAKSLPLIGTALLVGSAAYIDGYIITSRYSNETFAIFRYGAKEFPLFLIVASSFSTSMIPLVAEKRNLSNALIQIKENSRKMMHWFFPIAIIFLLTSQYLFPLVFNPNFAESYEVFDIYLLLIISRFVFPQSILMGLGKHKTLFWISISELLINISVSLILIQYLGFLGVAYGTLIAYFYEKFMLVYLAKTKIAIEIKKYLSIRTLIAYNLLLVFTFILKETFL